MRCDTCGSIVTADDIHCNKAGQEYCEQCHSDAELWLFGSHYVHSVDEHVCESCMVVTISSDERYCEGCITDIVTWLAASYIATDALYLMQVEDMYHELLLSSEYGGNYNVQSER